jgi:hypothetical protein
MQQATEINTLGMDEARKICHALWFINNQREKVQNTNSQYNFLIRHAARNEKIPN